MTIQVLALHSGHFIMLNVTSSVKMKWIFLITRCFLQTVVNVLYADRYQFRAKPVKSEIFVNSALGIKKVIPRQCTVPEEFHMEIEERLKQRHTDEVHDKTKEFEFHARPVPKAILDGPVVSIDCCYISFRCFLCSTACHFVH